MIPFSSGFVYLFGFGVPLGASVHLVGAAAKSRPFKTSSLWSQPEAVGGALQMFLQFISKQLLFPSFVCFSFTYQVPEEG